MIAGLNLAIIYGFALILGALVMALLYGLLCRSEAAPDKTDSPEEAGQ